MDDSEIHTITLADDPASIAHNEQMAARARDDLARHVRSAAAVFEQGADTTNATVVIAMSLIEHDAEDMPRERLAALLAAALVRLAHDGK